MLPACRTDGEELSLTVSHGANPASISFAIWLGNSAPWNASRRQLIAQATPEAFPKSWQASVDTQAAVRTRPEITLDNSRDKEYI